MKIVLDANVVISLLINPGKVVELFFLDKLEIYAPELLFVELERNLGVVKKKTRLSQKELEEMIDILQERIILVSEEKLKKQRKRAIEVCPDPKDISYFALALDLGCSVWSNEVRLKNQNEVKVYASHELIKKYRL